MVSVTLRLGEAKGNRDVVLPKETYLNSISSLRTISGQTLRTICSLNISMNTFFLLIQEWYIIYRLPCLVVDISYLYKNLPSPIALQNPTTGATCVRV